ncbi:MAG: sugar kinase [Desulfovibrio sp.]|nr:sugar kinase [Desulfovibrio sp.]
MWLIVGTVPDVDFALSREGLERAPCVEGHALHLPDGRTLPVQRGTAALAATAILTCMTRGVRPPALLLAGDTGRGDGSREAYAWLETHLASLAMSVGGLNGLTFHYLFPDVDWHNRVLLAVQALARRPLLVADAGYMYVAKMSGYADAYDLFTPDLGELAFLADEKAPHPFYTRGFLLAEDRDLPALLQRAQAHGNCPPNLVIKAAADHIVCDGRLLATVSEPCVPAMECIGGTGDLVTGLVTAFLAEGMPLCRAILGAARAARLLAARCQPTPATQISELIVCLPQLLQAAGQSLFSPPLCTAEAEQDEAS